MYKPLKKLWGLTQEVRICSGEKKSQRLRISLYLHWKILFRNFYESHGYYHARFKILRSQTGIHVQIEENSPVKINTVKVQSDFDLKHIADFKKGSVFTSKKFVTVKRNIIDTLNA